MNIPKAVLRLSGTRVMTIMIALILFTVIGMFFVPLGLPGRSVAAVVPFALAMLALECFYFGWLLCIALISNSLSEASLEIPPRIAISIFPIAVIYIGWLPFGTNSVDPPLSIIFPLHLFSMFVNFYILWFASRSIHASELERPPTLKDYLPTFLLLWFAILFPPAIRWTHERVQANIHAAA